METKELSKVCRDRFRSRWGFILACIGSAVGMGNIWRFPIMVSLWGGMTFLLPYFIFVILISSSGVLGEFSLGRMTGAGPVGAFGFCMGERGHERAGKITGLIPVLGSMALAVGYTVVVGWIFKYTFLALTGKLFNLGTDMDKIVGVFSKTAPETETLASSAAAVFKEGMGNNLFLITGLAVTAFILIMGIGAGIEKANKLMMPALFFLLVGLGIYIFTLPGSLEGYSYIFRLDLNGLRNPKIWIYAFGQAFFSLSVAGNGSVIYGSYLSKDEDLVYASRNIAFFDTLAALLASFVIIPAMASAGGDLSKGGPGLMFIWLVNVFNGMPGGKLAGMVFFICVLFAGLSSLVNLYEAPIATLQEVFSLKRKPACLIICLTGCICAMAIQGITGPWMDAVSIYICPLGASVAGIMFFWICKKERALMEVNTGRKKKASLSVIYVGRYIYVPLTVAAFILGSLLGGIG